MSAYQVGSDLSRSREPSMLGKLGERTPYVFVYIWRLENLFVGNLKNPPTSASKWYHRLGFDWERR